jgi:hypothetical protein
MQDSNPGHGLRLLGKTKRTAVERNTLRKTGTSMQTEAVIAIGLAAA